jgi:predicted Zn-dependent protease
MDRSRVLVEFLERAAAGGAQGAEILTEDVVGFHATAARGRIQRAVDTAQARATVRVWLQGGRRGEVTGVVSDHAQLTATALSLAQTAPPDPFGGPAGRVAAQGETSDIDDRRYGQLTREDRLEVVLQAERVARAVDKRFETFGFAYRDSRVIRHFANSRGLRLREAGTTFQVEGGVRSPTLDLELSEVVADRAFATAASLPFGGSLARRLVDLHGERTTFEGPIRVMMPPRVVADIFALLAPHFRRTALLANSSFLSRCRADGDLTLSPRLHLVDDGRLAGALRSRSFDDRGVSPVPLTLLRDGAVDAWYLGLNEARAIDTRPTGHEVAAGLQPGNLIIRGGTRSMNALLSEQTVPVLMLDHVRDLRGGLDVITGQLRVQASGRLVVPRNESVGVIPYLTLEGNLAEALSQVIDLASDTDRYEHVDAPGFLVDGLSVSAGR